MKRILLILATGALVNGCAPSSSNSTTSNKALPEGSLDHPIAQSLLQNAWCDKYSTGHPAVEMVEKTRYFADGRLQVTNESSDGSIHDTTTGQWTVTPDGRVSFVLSTVQADLSFNPKFLEVQGQRCHYMDEVIVNGVKEVLPPNSRPAYKCSCQ